MAYTKITRTAYGREALAYALNGRGHDGSEQRNLYVGGVNMMPPDVASYAEQMERYWIRADGKNKTQINRIIASFSPEELDPDDPESPLRAAQICDEFLQEYYPGRQAVVCVQNDGEGHKLHAHILVSNVSMCEVKMPGEKHAQKPYAGCKGYQLKFDYVKANFNNVAERYITLDQGEKAVDKVTQNERRMRQHNKNLAPGEQAKYIWKDDLKGRVKKAMSEASDKDDFLRKLTENGVEGKYHETGKGRKYYTYELTDISGFGDGKVPRNLRSRSYKLGADYDYEAIQSRFPDKPSPAPETPIVQSAPVPAKAAGIQDAIQALSAPHTGHQDAFVPGNTAASAKRQNEPFSASAPEIVQVMPHDPREEETKLEAERQRKERMEAENRRRREVLRRQMDDDSVKVAPHKPSASERADRAAAALYGNTQSETERMARNAAPGSALRAALLAAAELTDNDNEKEDDYGYW